MPGKTVKTDKHFISIVEVTRVPSVNEALKVGRQGTKTWLYLNPEISNFKKRVTQALQKEGAEEYFADKKDKIFTLEILFLLNSNVWRRDTTNLIKYLEEAVRDAIKIDESRNFQGRGRKIETKEEFESILIAIETLDNFSTTLEEVLNELGQ